jgi:indolepyruvate ferredoxin oxidoreductase beta subunit
MLNIMIVGVGGQGSLLASRILGSLFISQGLDVKLSEVHGMAQRGGSVVTYIRAGEEIASPLIPEGECDVIISFEKIEAARYLPWLKKGGLVVVNDQKISPLSVLTGAAAYPDEILEKIADMGVKLVAFDALAAAAEAGSERAANVALLGAASREIGFSEEAWKDAIRGTVKENFVELNLKAFEIGRAKS